MKSKESLRRSELFRILNQDRSEDLPWEREVFMKYERDRKTRRQERLMVVAISAVMLMLTLFGKTPEQKFCGAMMMFLMVLLDTRM